MDKIKHENHSKFIKNNFIAIFLIIILEGAIRKWFLPNSGTYIVFLRDLLILNCIYYGFKNKLFQFNQNFEKFVLLWTHLIIIWTMIQFTFTELPILIFLLGLRNWVLYIWFSLLFYRIINFEDILSIIKVIILTMIPLSVISITQHFMPVEHFLNRLPTEGHIFQVIPGIVRTTGTFSHVYGYTSYLMLLCPLIFALMISELNIKFNKYIFIIIVSLFFLAVLTSGSRATIFFTILMFLPLLYSVLRIDKSIKKILTLFLIFLICYILVDYLFLDALTANFQRIEDANITENTYQRLMNTIFGSKETWANLSLLGKGIGLGSNAAEIILDRGNIIFLLGEFESDRIINEGGVIGVLFLVIKFLSIFFLFVCIRKINKEKKPLAFIYWFYLISHLLTSQITGQVTSHGFTYLALSIGFVLLKDDLYKNNLNKDKITL